MDKRDIYKAEIVAIAGDRKVCNCGNGFYDEKGVCAHGCESTQYSAKLELVASLAAERDRLSMLVEK